MACAIEPTHKPWLASVLTAPLHAAVEWYRISLERAALRDLPADRIDDLGLSRRDLEDELRRPFWQAQRDI